MMMNEKIKEKISTVVNDRKYTINDVPMMRYRDGIYATPATVSKIVRGILKAEGIRATDYRFKSESYSGGSSFSLFEKEATEDVVKVRPYVKAILGAMTSGSFNGMIDLYEYSKTRPTLEIRSTGEKVDYGVRFAFLENAEGYTIG